jgi:hypothetical protein
VITAQTADQIRDDLLAQTAADTADDAAPLDLRQGSPEYVEAAALGVLLAALERQAEGAATQILPNTASGQHLTAHGTTADLPREAGELDAPYRARQRAWWAQRTGTGGGEDVVAWAEATSTCDEAYAYPLLQTGSTSTTRYGCWTLVALGPAQGSSASNTRLLAAGDLAKVKKYLEGEADAAGAPASGEELRPIASVHGNWAVEAVTETTQNVDVQVTAAPTHPFPWSGSHAIVSATLADADVAGDQTALVGLDVLVNVGTAAARGGYIRATVASASFGGVNTTLTFAEALAAVPTGTIYPCPPFFEVARTAAFDLFDALGPGDTAVTARRWPTQSERGRATLYAAQLEHALLEVDGVVGVSLVTPSGNVTPAAKALVTLGTFLVRST